METLREREVVLQSCKLNDTLRVAVKTGMLHYYRIFKCGGQKRLTVTARLDRMSWLIVALIEMIVLI